MSIYNITLKHFLKHLSTLGWLDIAFVVSERCSCFIINISMQNIFFYLTQSCSTKALIPTFEISSSGFDFIFKEIDPKHYMALSLEFGRTFQDSQRRRKSHNSWNLGYHSMSGIIRIRINIHHSGLWQDFLLSFLKLSFHKKFICLDEQRAIYVSTCSFSRISPMLCYSVSTLYIKKRFL